MIRADALVVGGGPAGSSCARALVRAGLDVVVVDAAVFPRDKVCAGWITPPVLDALELDVDDYKRGRTFQPISGFRTGVIGRTATVDVAYSQPVSFGIRRCEFDHYLLSRSGARLASGQPVRHMRRTRGSWIVDERFEAPVLVGAGGHFCPVAKHLNGSPGTGQTVAAQETEFTVAGTNGGLYTTPGERPELYFNPDLRGYGWCFRKQSVVNLGFGSLDHRRLPHAVAAFVTFLRELGRVPEPAGWCWHGHAYRLYAPAPRRVVDAGVVLVGDAAGLAYPESGEGIRPAIESGLMAAETIVAAQGSYARSDLEPYETRLRERFSAKAPHALRAAVPQTVLAAFGRGLLRMPWFVRHIVLDRWFLHATG